MMIFTIRVLVFAFVFAERGVFVFNVFVVFVYVSYLQVTLFSNLYFMSIPKNLLKHSNSFVVLPKHCNYMMPLIFGGAFMSELDLCAAILANQLVKATPLVDNAVTYKADFTFHGPSYSGDVIHMDAIVKEVRSRSISITVEAFREPRDVFARLSVATAEFVFITRLGEDYRHHGLVL